MIYKNYIISKAENLIFSFIYLLIACLITITYHFQLSVDGTTVFCIWTVEYDACFYRLSL